MADTNIDVQMGQWHIKAYEHDIEHGNYDVTADGPGQSFEIEADGTIVIEITNREIGHGYSGDHAQARYIPFDVMARAMQMWTDIGGRVKAAS